MIKDKGKILRTTELIDRAKEEDIEELLEHVQRIRTIPEIIGPYLKPDNKEGMSKEDLGYESGCSRAYIYRIMEGRQHPEKDVLLRIALVLCLSVEETQEMLRASQKSRLTSSDPRDICVIYGLINELNLDEMDELLLMKGFDPLYPESA